MFTAEQKQALEAPLDKAHVAQRSQSGRQLSYIEGWHAIAEANRIFGFDAWTRETLDVRCVAERERSVGQGQGWGVTYIAKVRVTVGEVTREGTGAGHGIDRDLGLAHESAIKEAETDAMKRAFMTFGNPFGLALYDKSQANVSETPNLSVAPEGPDWWGCSGPGLSSNAAKQQGLDKLHDDLRREIGNLSSAAEWKKWCADHSAKIATMPKAWRVILRDDAEQMARELGVDLNNRKAA